MRLLCVLNGGVDHPSSRLRILQHLDHLKERGITADVFVAKGTRAVDLADLARRARRSDAILVQKKLFSRWKLPLLLGSAPLLFDLDDAVFVVSPDERERFGEERAEARARSRRRRLAAVLKRSRKVIAGNPFPARPPQYIRAQFYRYQFAPPGDPTHAWWKRTWLGSWADGTSDYR